MGQVSSKSESGFQRYDWFIFRHEGMTEQTAKRNKQTGEHRETAHAAGVKLYRCLRTQLEVPSNLEKNEDLLFSKIV